MKEMYITGYEWKEMATEDILTSIEIALRVLEYERDDARKKNNKHRLLVLAKDILRFIERIELERAKVGA